MSTIQTLHAILFLSEKPIEAKELAEQCGCSISEIELALQQLDTFYSDTPIELLQSRDKYQLVVTQSVLPEKFVPSPEQLSSVALEVLSIVAYRQPITRAEIEEIRGIGSEQTIKSLVEKGLVAIEKKQVQGVKIYYYHTTDEFLRTTGIRNLKELPEQQNANATQ